MDRVEVKTGAIEEDCPLRATLIAQPACLILDLLHLGIEALALALVIRRLRYVMMFSKCRLKVRTVTAALLAKLLSGSRPPNLKLLACSRRRISILFEATGKSPAAGSRPRSTGPARRHRGIPSVCRRSRKTEHERKHVVPCVNSLMRSCRRRFLHAGMYRTLPSRRVYIPKAAWPARDGTTPRRYVSVLHSAQRVRCAGSASKR